MKEMWVDCICLIITPMIFAFLNPSVGTIFILAMIAVQLSKIAMCLREMIRINKYRE